MGDFDSITGDFDSITGDFDSGRGEFDSRRGEFCGAPSWCGFSMARVTQLPKIATTTTFSNHLLAMVSWHHCRTLDSGLNSHSEYSRRLFLRETSRRPIRRRKRRYVLTADQSDAGSAGMFSRRTNQTREAQVYSQGGPIRRKKRRYILTADQSDASSAGLYSGQASVLTHRRSGRYGGRSGRYGGRSG
eukprot:3404867-Pyramimonas_sp.AAC.1